MLGHVLNEWSMEIVNSWSCDLVKCIICRCCLADRACWCWLASCYLVLNYWLFHAYMTCISLIIIHTCCKLAENWLLYCYSIYLLLYITSSSFETSQTELHFLLVLFIKPSRAEPVVEQAFTSRAAQLVSTPNYNRSTVFIFFKQQMQETSRCGAWRRGGNWPVGGQDRTASERTERCSACACVCVFFGYLRLLRWHRVV